IGGEAVIVVVVDDLVARAIADPAVNFARKGTPHEWQPTDANVQRLKERLVQFLGTATGGPQRYEGENLRTAHRGMRISKSEFDAFVKDFQASLQQANVPEKERKELLDIFKSARGPIVEDAATR
ncbi:MAG: hemoglobin, partial [Phycisphaerales bacterium]|nr:hemoglobin [Phycisphaerales bacterium]